MQTLNGSEPWTIHVWTDVPSGLVEGDGLARGGLVRLELMM
jgi:hypothetical protein